MLPTSLAARQLALALDMLEPGDALALLRSAGPGAILRLSTRRALAGLPAVLAAPPAQLSWGTAATLSSATLSSATLSGGGPGDRLRIRVDPPAPPASLRPFLLQTGPSGTVRLLPAGPGPWPRLDLFLDEDGQRCIDVVLDDAPGPRSLLLALLSAEEVDEAWPEGDPRDAQVVAALRAGALPGGERLIAGA